MSEYHGLGPDDIVGMRAKEKSFVKIHDEIGRGKAPRASRRARGKRNDQ
jgi:hypothetical protein